MNTATLQISIEVDDKGSVKVKQFGKAAEDAGKDASEGFQKADKSLDSMNGSIKTAIGLLASMAAAFKLADIVKDAALAAARFETLGVVMKVVGQNTGYTAQQMEDYSKALQKTGISMTESRSNITKMAQAHLDLAESTKLARIAQDAAVIGNMNSSEAFAHMIYGIQSGQVEVLRTIGINVNFENSYKTLAEQLGKTTKDLTEGEKATARMNAVIASGPAIAGSYEAAMNTAGKQITSFTRYLDDFSVKMGEAFGPATKILVEAATEAMKQMQEEISRPDAQAALRDLSSSLAKTIVQLGKDLPDAVSKTTDAIQGIANIYNALPSGAVAAGGAGLIGTILFGPQVGAVVAMLTLTSTKINEFKAAHPEIFSKAQGELRFKVPFDNTFKKDSWMTTSNESAAAAGRATIEINKMADAKKLDAAASEKATSANRNYFDSIEKVFGENPQASIKDHVAAVESAHQAFLKLTNTSQDYKILELQATFAKEAEKIGDDAQAMSELNAVLRANIALQNYLKEPLPMDPWLDRDKGKVAAAKRVEDEISDNEVKEHKRAAESVQKIYDNMLQNIQKEFGDTIESMLFEDGLKSWGDFFDSIVKMFEKMIAQMISAWITTGIAGLFSGLGFGGFSLGGLSLGGGAAGVASTGLSLASAWGTLEKGASWLAESLGLASATAATEFIPAVAGMSGSMELLGAEAVAASKTIGAGIWLGGGETAPAAAGAAGSGMSATLSSAASFAAIVGVSYWISSGGINDLLGANTKVDTKAKLREYEASGGTSMSKADRDWWMAMLVTSQNSFGIDSLVNPEDMEAFAKAHEELLSMTVDTYEYIRNQQEAIIAASKVPANTLAGFALDYNSDPTIEMALKIADDSKLTIDEKMLQLGFVASASGGWDSEVTLRMIAELSDQGVPWADIQNAMNTWHLGGVAFDDGGVDLTGRASGGGFPSSSFWAGERGMELVDGANRQVYSHDDSMRIAGAYGINIPGFVSGTTKIGYSASATAPNVVFNIANNTGGMIEARATRVSREDQKLVIDMVLDGIDRNVSGIRSALGR